ncbi:hypothetical protein [Tenacibaculum soleae]|uniref:hypothetical protein n=1 Tax=Tenacibaculum soleae TaxID=447689 RepID=UPI0026E3B6DB|nr:hypothetical protein [Tenacibaculum soleae]MDO6813793.1 hypothetical protein [Tenacibaculum soleae]
MNLQQTLSYLARFYKQKTALIAKKNTDEYNEEQYNSLMKFYNGKIEELRARVESENANALLQFDTDRANEIKLTDGVVLVSKRTVV